MGKPVLGISAYYHDSAAALIIDGEIIAAAQEERFTRKKNDACFPTNAIEYVLDEAGIKVCDIQIVAFYEKPFIRFERLLETYHAFAPKGLKSFLKTIPVWIGEKLFFKRMVRKELAKIGIDNYTVFFPDHHLSHASSAFYPSPFEESAILTLDGVGEWTTTSIAIGNGKEIKVLRELHFPHSLGLLYSAFTAYCGFKVNCDEYKLMGLAPYGNDASQNYKIFKTKIRDQLIDIRKDGSFLLNMKYFEFATGLQMYHTPKWNELFGIEALKPCEKIPQPYADLALAVQHITEDIILKLAQTVKEITNADNLVLAGGVALNCVANGKLLKSGLFNKIWIQPAAGDAGGAVGAALCQYYLSSDKKRQIQVPDGMKSSMLGPSYSNNQVEAVLKKHDAVFVDFQGRQSELIKQVANLIAEGKVVGCFRGRMEYGPRALGARSILADARSSEMQQVLNLKIKNRENFRPFAPVVLLEDATEYFDLSVESPYMLNVVPVKNSISGIFPGDFKSWTMKEKLSYSKGKFPAITHVDGSARVQTVNSKSNPFLYKLIHEFKKHTGVGVLVNTSFNERGEPIVCTPDDAFRSFMRTEMNVLLIEDFLLYKEDQISSVEFMLKESSLNRPP